MSRKRKRKRKKSFNNLTIIIVLGLLLAAPLYLSLKSEKKNSRTAVTSSLNGRLEPNVPIKEKKDNTLEQGKQDKESVTAPEENRDAEKEPVKDPVKANENLVDPVIENYLNIYINLLNDSELEFYYLDNVVLKNSTFYNTLTDEIEKLRSEDSKYSLDNFSVNKIYAGDAESELKAEVSQTMNNVTSTYVYTVYFDKEGIFIKDRK